MSTAEQEVSVRKQQMLEKKRLSEIIRDWVQKNKKVFWRYEVSCFYKTYVIKVANLPKPSIENIKVSSNNRLLNIQQKTQLCNVIEKASPDLEALRVSSIDVQIDYINDAVVVEVV